MYPLSELLSKIMNWSDPIPITKDMIYITNERGETLIHWMCVYDRDDIIMKLLEHGADVNRCDGVGGSPLHWAICNNNRYIAKILLDKGASINVCDDRGWTPLHYAANIGAYNMIKMLIERGANRVVIDENCCDAATIALRNGYNKVSRLICNTL